MKISVFTFIIFFCFSIPLYGCQPLELKTYATIIPQNVTCCLGADICGSTSDFGIFDIQNNDATLLFSLHTKTKTIEDFSKVICDVMAYAQDKYNISITHACIGAPGVATADQDYANVYGLFEIDSKEIIKKSGLLKVLVVNDLVTMGHGLQTVDRNKIIQIYGELTQEHGIRSIIGAKAGLGSCTQIWNDKAEQYVTHPGEGGIVEFAPNGQLEYDAMEYIKKSRNSNVVYWDAFVSGCGISRIYKMLKSTNQYYDSLLLDNAEPTVIFNNQNDELCRETIKFFFALYARFARNHVFPLLPYGGLYLTGSIAAKNVELFDTLFVPEYSNCGGLQTILKCIPVYVVADTNVSLYGAVQCLMNENK